MRKVIWFPCSQFVREYWLAFDPYDIYRQRRVLGLVVWRGREWWMG